MASIAKMMNQEIRRLAKSEAKALMLDVRKATVRLRKDNAALKRRVSQLAKGARRLEAMIAKCGKPAPAPESARNARFFSKGIRSLRKKLGLSQEKFAKLVGVTSQSVYNWESKGGLLRLRGATLDKLLVARGLGAREAKGRLGQLGAAAKARAGRRKGVRKVRRAKKRR